MRLTVSANRTGLWGVFAASPLIPRNMGGGGRGTRKQKHIPLVDPEVFELPVIDNF